jgi:hypothetical protein
VSALPKGGFLLDGEVAAMASEHGAPLRLGTMANSFDSTSRWTLWFGDVDMLDAIEAKRWK